MDREEVKNAIVELVNDHTGIRGTEIPVRLEEGYRMYMDIHMLDELVREKRIAELECVFPKQPYRLKSLYVPINTKIKTINL